VPRARQWLEGGDNLRLTGLWDLPEDDDARGLRRADVIGHYFITIPPDDVLRRGTLEYQDVFTAAEPQLRSWLAGRVVIVGDLRGDADRYAYVDGRRVPGPYAHAAAIEAILQSVTIRSPTDAQTWIIVGLAVLAGGAAGLFVHRSSARCVLLLGLLAVTAVVASVEAYRENEYLVNPLVPVFALLAGGACVAFACRQARVGNAGAAAWEVSS
jgi:CHASE2 domain-containing sensor protein